MLLVCIHVVIAWSYLHLVGDVVSGIVDRPEGAVPDLPQIIEYLVWVLALEQFGHLGVLKGPGPG